MILAWNDWMIALACLLNYNILNPYIKNVWMSYDCFQKILRSAYFCVIHKFSMWLL